MLFRSELDVREHHFLQSAITNGSTRISQEPTPLGSSDNDDILDFGTVDSSMPHQSSMDTKRDGSPQDLDRTSKSPDKRPRSPSTTDSTTNPITSSGISKTHSEFASTDTPTIVISGCTSDGSLPHSTKPANDPRFRSEEHTSELQSH